MSDESSDTTQRVEDEDEDVDETKRLDPFPKVWAEILKRVPQADRQGPPKPP